MKKITKIDATFFKGWRRDVVEKANNIGSFLVMEDRGDEYTILIKVGAQTTVLNVDKAAVV